MKLFTPIFIIAVCLGAYLFYISPTYSNIQILSTQKDNYTQVLSKAKEVASKRDDILASYNAISPDDLSRLAKIVPINFDPVTFVLHLNAIASKYGLTIASMQIIGQDSNGQQVVSAAAPSLYQTQSVTFSVIGQYGPFVNFLKDLESGLYLVDVKELSIKSGQSSKMLPASLQFTLTVDTYSLN
jgi:Tfp pilus assembly protein PilO